MPQRGVRVLAVALAVTVLAVTGYGWTTYRHLAGGLTTTGALHGGADDGATDILLVGLDSRTDVHGNPLPQSVLNALTAGPDDGEVNTDTLILLRVPDDPDVAATAVSIPRDSYVDIPGGYGEHKINSAYGRAMTTAQNRLAAQGVTGAARTQQAEEAGRQELIATVEQLTGVSVDHYAEVNLAGFAAITTAVGGVPVCLKAPVHDSYSGADFPAGVQSLSGPPALAFVRQRHGLPRGDLDRVVRQQAFLASLTHTVLSAGTLADPGRLSGLIDTVQQYVVLDPGFDLLTFASRTNALTAGNVHFSTIPTGDPGLQTPEDGEAVQVDPAQVEAYMAGLVNPPTSPAAPAPAAPQPAVTVDVRNATGRAGLAGDVELALHGSGYTDVTTGNAAAARASAVRAAPGSDAAATALAGTLGGLPVETSDTVAAGHVEVVLGRDYAGPGSSGATAPAPATPTPAPAAPAISANGVPCVN